MSGSRGTSARAERASFSTRLLDSGLRVVVTPQPNLHRAHLGFYVRIGSRFETKRKNGLSHFLEHMLYRGTERLPSAHQVNDAVESLGGYLYAATHADFGVFSVTLPPESLAAATALFREVLTQPIFSDIELEKGIVEEEILEDLDDDGRQVDADNLSRALVYKDHPLGYTITGDAETVRTFDEKLLREHHAAHYVGDSSVLAIGGAVSESEALQLADLHFSAFPRGAKATSPPPVHVQKKPRLKLVENVSSQTELRVTLRAFAENDPRRAAMDMLMRIVDDGMSTRLYHRICDAQGLCYDVSAGFDGYEDDGLVDIAAGVQHARTSKVVREILAMFEEIAKEGPDEDELAKARRRFDWETIGLRDSVEDWAGFHAGGFLFDRFETPDERSAALHRVTAKDVQAVAALLCEPSRLNVTAVGLFEDGEEGRLTDLVKGYRGLA